VTTWKKRNGCGLVLTDEQRPRLTGPADGVQWSQKQSRASRACDMFPECDAALDCHRELHGIPFRNARSHDPLSCFHAQPGAWRAFATSHMFVECMRHRRALAPLEGQRKTRPTACLSRMHWLRSSIGWRTSSRSQSLWNGRSRVASFRGAGVSSRNRNPERMVRGGRCACVARDSGSGAWHRPGMTAIVRRLRARRRLSHPGTFRSFGIVHRMPRRHSSSRVVKRCSIRS
jgi:hypothetical protein